MGQNNPEYHFIEGNALLYMGRYVEAIAEFDKAIRLNPNDPRYHNNKGIALLNLGRYDEALAEYDKAINLNPNNPEYHFNKGATLANLGHYAEALAEFDKAISLDPNNPLYHYGKGFVYAKMGEVDLGFNVLADLAGRSESARQQLCAKARDEMNNKGVDPNVKEMLKRFISNFCTE